jgi:GNAT superfamily N-acetyltransferase
VPAEPPRPGSGLAWRIEPLGREHDRSRFDCGEPALNEYLVRYARQNQESGIARTFVAVFDEEPNRILGYYSLTVAGIDKANLPQAAIKRFPNHPIPVVRLARLAVDRGAQGCGLGEDLLMDALTRCLRAAREIGIAAVLLDAKHDRAKRFYARYEFESLPGHPLTLWLPMASIRRLFGEE